MESHYESQGLASSQATQSFKKPPGFIDFYRQSDGLHHPQQQFDRHLDEIQPDSTPKCCGENFNKDQVSLCCQQLEKQTLIQDMVFGQGGVLVMGRQDQPSPIYSSMKMDNYMMDQQQTTKAGGMTVKEEGKKAQLLSAADKQVALKRRSIENNRQHVRAELKPSAYQTKSALSNYPQQQQIQQQQQLQQQTNQMMQQNQAQQKQFNKQGKVERDPIADSYQQQQPFKQGIMQRTLAKSQSQNRLMLVSPDTLMNKGNQGELMMLQDAVHDKNSFIKDQLVPSSRMSTHIHQSDPMYKQHLQYSSGPQGNHHNKAWQLRTNSHQNLILSHLSTNNCTFCNKTHGGMTTVMHHQCSAIYCSKDQQGLMIQNNLSKKYSTNRDYYNLKIVNDLIYNENTHIVSIFKDYLILDDINEFLKRYYSQPETKVRLPKLCSFYDKYSQVFPNYVVLPESKYMFKNIQRKQKLIDEQYQLQEHLANKLHQTLADEDKLFNTKFYNSYYSMNDLSMTKKQYEDQAKQIAIFAGKKVAIDQMKMDELVDRFLMRDSESNILLQTEAGLDFSGFTQQNSTFFNQHQMFEKAIAPTKVTTAAATNKQVAQQLQQAKAQPKPQLVSQQIQVLQQKNQHPQQTKKLAPNQVISANNNQGNQSQKRQKTSFNNTQATGKSAIQKVEALKIATTTNGGSSQKNTPRVSKQTEEQLKQHASPATKEALSSYLQGCQIGELHQESPSQTNLKPKALIPTASQSSLQSNQVLMSSHSLAANRPGMKSQQTLMVSSNQITNLKKTTRLSNGGAGISQKQKPTTGTVNTMSASNGFNKGTVSQLQQQQQTQYVLSSSRNQQIGNNSTQKSAKSVNSHAKYLSGGNEQYQKLLAGINGGTATIPQVQQQQQATYMTHFDTLGTSNMGGMGNSSTKKPAILAQQRSKGDLETYLVSGAGLTQQSNMKDPFLAGIGSTVSDQQDIVTGEDCDDCGIADERFASPEAKLVFSTIDEAAAAYQNGRKSLEAGMLISSSDDKILSQATNYDQIKRHLEQYITINQQTTFDSMANASGKKQQYLSNVNNYPQQSNHLTSGVPLGVLAPISQTSESGEFPKGGFSRDHHLTQSAHSNNGLDSRNSQKHFESLKQKIRGAYEGGGANTDTQQSASKTPVKSQSHSKKSTVVAQNRMSIESKNGPNNDNLMMMVSQGGVQSTQAHRGGQLQFAQSSFSSQNNANTSNYRSITNIQQRKGSKPQLENSMENKRLSSGTNTQIRQSFRDHQQISTANTNLQGMSQEQQLKIKRCITGKTLNINDINQQTFGGLNHQTQQQTLSQQITTALNPTYLSSGNQKVNNLASIQNPSFNHHQAQQAANTVRVMTPSYSLASLSKIISPTQQASPLTMTVTLGTANQSRKQLVGSNKTTKQQYSSNSNSQGTYLLGDKQTKIIKQSGHSKNNVNTQSKMASPALTSSSSSTLNIQTTINQQNSQGKRAGVASNGLGSPVPAHLVQSNSLQVFQVTPRGVLGASVHQQQQEIHRLPRGTGGNPALLENSQNLSVSTENNSGSGQHPLINIAAKAIESKNPKFMRTIEETGTQQPSYNTMLSASLGHRKSGTGLTMSVSQAQFELQKKAQSKVQTVVGTSAQSQSIKRASAGGTMTHSVSVTQFKSPQQTIGLQSKKAGIGRYNATGGPSNM